MNSSVFACACYFDVVFYSLSLFSSFELDYHNTELTYRLNAHTNKYTRTHSTNKVWFFFHIGGMYLSHVHFYAIHFILFAFFSSLYASTGIQAKEIVISNIKICLFFSSGKFCFDEENWLKMHVVVLFG